MLSNSTKVRLYLPAQFNNSSICCPIPPRSDYTYQLNSIKVPYAVQFHQSQSIRTSSIQPKYHMLSNSTYDYIYQLIQPKYHMPSNSTKVRLYLPAQFNQSTICCSIPPKSNYTYQFNLTKVPYAIEFHQSDYTHQLNSAKVPYAVQFHQSQTVMTYQLNSIKEP